MNIETCHGTQEVSYTQNSCLHYFNPFSTGTHCYLEICVPLDHFIDIRKGLWRSED
ncbi:hypothetical protein E2C01_062792 [Portunus trituberculatus]|uniref:Uncharacterized protein n=1 Tax=Portunus trituberculatus TaxID=210409 RepID=A0A5B7H8W1_PORTR|nr:hypothetical protein [Portunus trituberculatus]